jgi:hypothetical protein
MMVEAAVLGLLLVHAAQSEEAQRAGLQEKALLITKLKLTDLCLFPEARYARHPSQADWHAAFQDHPLSLEHFPAGSFTVPPTYPKWDVHENLD